MPLKIIWFTVTNDRGSGICSVPVNPVASAVPMLLMETDPPVSLMLLNGLDEPIGEEITILPLAAMRVS